MRRRPGFDGMSPAGSFVVPADHPCLPGHFPGQPVVPAVVLLDEVFALLPQPVRGVVTVKFTRPVLPGETVAVTCGAPAGGRMAFAGTVDGAPALRGTALVA